MVSYGVLVAERRSCPLAAPNGATAACAEDRANSPPTRNTSGNGRSVRMGVYTGFGDGFDFTALTRLMPTTGCGQDEHGIPNSTPSGDSSGS